MTSTLTPATRRASFAIGNEQTAKRVVDLLNESFFEGQAAIAAFEGAGGRWDITVHFAEPPDEGAIRELVGLAAGDEVAQDIASTRWKPRTGSRPRWRIWSRSAPGASSCTASMTAPTCRPTSSASRSRRRWRSAPGITAPRAAACCCSIEVLKAHLPRRVLDLGTGTGVLAIAAAKALRIKVLASDIDPLSVRVARENARLNGVGDLVQAIRATGFSAPQFATRAPFDLVLANILANPLRQMATPMARHLAPSALVILSGLLPHQAQSVVAAYRARGLVLVRHLEIEGWSSLLMQRVG